MDKILKKEKFCLNNLLKINALSIQKDRISRQKPQLKIFSNTDIIEKIDYKYYDKNKPNLTSTSFYNKNLYHKIDRNILSNKSRKNKTLYSGKIPLEYFGKATFDCTKTFYTTENEDLKKNKKIYTKVKNKVFNPFNNEIMNINNET